jgi:predicted nucleic acid-binding protein
VPEFPLLRVYLDSNVLFSASRDPQSHFLDFWRLRNVAVVTSQYAVGEVSRNVHSFDHRQRFERLLAQTQFVSDADIRSIPPHITLAAKDQPILAAAISASVDYLATGDKNHFALLYNGTVSGVRVVSPAHFLAAHKDRLLA